MIPAFDVPPAESHIGVTSPHRPEVEPETEGGHPLVSVVIIFLDEGRFLAEAIDSVRAQTFGNWELLLVDDGSTDGSVAIAQQAAASDPARIRYLTHPGRANRGMSASRNLGLAAAHGQYIAWLDGDDVWRPNKLERQLDLLRENPRARLVYGPLTLWHSWTGIPGDDRSDRLYGTAADYVSLPTNRLYTPPQLLRQFLRHKDLVPSGVLVERSLLVEVGGSEEAFRGNYEDGVVMVKVCLRAAAFCSAESWYLYRQHDDSYCRAERRAGRSDGARLQFLVWCAGYLRSEGVGLGRLRFSLWWTIQTLRFAPLRHVDLHGQRVARRLRRVIVTKGRAAGGESMGEQVMA